MIKRGGLKKDCINLSTLGEQLNLLKRNKETFNVQDFKVNFYGVVNEGCWLSEWSNSIKSLFFWSKMSK